MITSMSSEKATALVLRVVEFSETSSVVTLFTREFGKIHGLAKGARRPKGPFESALDLLALCRIVFLRKSSGTLDLLTEAKLQRRFRPRGHDLSSLYAGYYVAELLSELTDDYDPHPELFDAAEQTLAGPAGEGPIVSWIVRFELAALRLLGAFAVAGGVRRMWPAGRTGWDGWRLGCWRAECCAGIARRESGRSFRSRRAFCGR